MGSKADYLENKVLNLVLNATAFTAPATHYIGFSTTTITDAGGNITEPAIGTAGYTRIAVTANTTNWPTATTGTISNGVALETPTSSGAWVASANLIDFFLSDAASAGNILYYGTLTTAQAVTATNQKLQFAIGALVITEG